MKIMLIQPPIQDFYETDIRLQPLGLCMLKATVRKFLPQVDIHVRDYHQGFGRKTLALPPDLSYLHEYYACPDSSPFSAFYHYYHFGAPFEVIGRDVERERPDLVGISSLFSAYHREALACAREIKRRIGVPIMLGGSHVSASPLTALNDPDVDFIIRGEGERPFVEFLKAFQSGTSLEQVPNLGFKKKGAPVLNPLEDNYGLDEMPLANLSDLPVTRYLIDKQPLCFLSTSRGCPHRCTFCSVHLTFGKKFRMRSVPNIISEIRQRHTDGYRAFDFEDDNLSFDKTRFEELLEGLISEFQGKDLRFMAMNGISYLSLDRETLQLMKKAGFTHLNLSLVSAEEKVLRRAGRPHTVPKYLEVVEQAHSLSFEIVSYQILGLPYETLEEMIGTMAFMASLPVLIGASIFYLAPDAPMTTQFPVMTDADTFKSRSTAMAFETEEFSRDDLFTLFITARIVNFLKALKLGAEEATMAEALEAASKAGDRQEKGTFLLNLLFEERVLYAATRQGLKARPRFKAALFFRVLKEARHIKTLDGGLIHLSPFIQSPKQGPAPRGAMTEVGCAGGI